MLMRRNPHIISEGYLTPFDSTDNIISNIAKETCLLSTLTRDHVRFCPDKLRKKILSKFSHRCALCHRSEKEVNRSLEIHHIDYYHEGGSTSEVNLIPLCKTCHVFVHIGIWTRSFLDKVIQKPHMVDLIYTIDDISESKFRETLYTIKNQQNSWQHKIKQLLTLWRRLPFVKPSSASLRLELSIRIQWEISAVLTTYCRSGETIKRGKFCVPVNRYVAIRLCENALQGSRLLKTFDETLSCDLRLGVCHSYGVHYRTMGYIEHARKIFEKNCKELIDEDERESVIKDTSWLAYLLTAYGIDLIKRRTFKRPTSLTYKGRSILNDALRIAKNQGSVHSVADTMLRVAEGMIYTPGQLDDGFKALRDSEDLVKGDIPIIKIIYRKLLGDALAFCGDSYGAEREYTESINMAEKHSLDDQWEKLNNRLKWLYEKWF